MYIEWLQMSKRLYGEDEDLFEVSVALNNLGQIKQKQDFLEEVEIATTLYNLGGILRERGH